MIDKSSTYKIKCVCVFKRKKEKKKKKNSPRGWRGKPPGGGGSSQNLIKQTASFTDGSCTPFGVSGINSLT